MRRFAVVFVKYYARCWKGGGRVVWWCEYVIFVVTNGYGISVTAQVVMCVS